MYKLIHVSLVIYRDEYKKKSGSHRSASVTNHTTGLNLPVKGSMKMSVFLYDKI